MLDKLSKKIVKVLEVLCNDNGYSIIEINEIVTALSNKIDVDLLRKYIDELSSKGYIDVKYVDDKQICLAIMPKARGLEEETVYKKKTTNKYIRIAIIMSAISAISGFLGAFVGAYIFSILG